MIIDRNSLSLTREISKMQDDRTVGFTMSTFSTFRVNIISALRMVNVFPALIAIVTLHIFLHTFCDGRITMSPITVITKPGNYVFVGDNIGFMCVGEKADKFKWKYRLNRDDAKSTEFTCDSNALHCQTPTNKDGVSTFTVMFIIQEYKVQADELGFQCAVEGGENTNVKWVKVRYKAKTLASQAAFHDYVLRNSSADITCIAEHDGWPRETSDIFWLKNSKLYECEKATNCKLETKYTKETFKTSSTITISNLAFSDAANYTCQAQKQGGGFHSQVTPLKVAYKVYPSCVHDVDGKSLTITCAKSLKQMIITDTVWSFKKKEGDSFSRFSSEEKMVISNFTEEANAGTYKCGMNSGLIQGQALVYVAEKGEKFEEKNSTHHDIVCTRINDYEKRDSYFRKVLSPLIILFAFFVFLVLLSIAYNIWRRSVLQKERELRQKNAQDVYDMLHNKSGISRAGISPSGISRSGLSPSAHSQRSMLSKSAHSQASISPSAHSQRSVLSPSAHSQAGISPSAHSQRSMINPSAHSQRSMISPSAHSQRSAISRSGSNRIDATRSGLIDDEDY